MWSAQAGGTGKCTQVFGTRIRFVFFFGPEDDDDAGALAEELLEHGGDDVDGEGVDVDEEHVPQEVDKLAEELLEHGGDGIDGEGVDVDKTPVL